MTTKIRNRERQKKNPEELKIHFERDDLEINI